MFAAPHAKGRYSNIISTARLMRVCVIVLIGLGFSFLLGITSLLTAPTAIAQESGQESGQKAKPKLEQTEDVDHALEDEEAGKKEDDEDDSTQMIQFRLCGEVYIRQASYHERLSLTTNEEKLVCGDPQTQAWQNIPFNQAIYFLKTFLQSRGYHKIETTIRDQKLYVTVGAATLISKVLTDGLPEPIDVTRYWPVYGRKLTPANLDDLEKWLLQELGHKGFACVQLTINGNPDTGVVTVKAANTVKSTFPQIDSDGISGLVGGVERRYDPFQTGDPYNTLLLDLSVTRMLREDIVINSIFQTNCSRSADDELEITIDQSITSGKPRLVSFGLGFDTENYFIAQASWKNARLGSMGSKLETLAYLSYREQRASMLFDWYYAPIVINHFLRSTVNFTRERQTKFDSRTITVDSGPAWNFDRLGHRFFAWIRPSYELIETQRGDAPATNQIMSFKGTLEVESHAHEYFAQQPQTGHEVRLNYTANRKDMTSDISANRYQLDATKLWNLFDYSPAIWILGLRLSAATTTVHDSTTLNDLPPNYRYFLGGSKNMRGFGLEKLPANSTGALSMAYTGIETRVANILPLGIQPILFADFSRLSTSSFKLDRTWFWSPGAGVNWASPIGTFRLTLAHGFVEDSKNPEDDELNNLSRWQFYFSYGEQF